MQDALWPTRVPLRHHVPGYLDCDLGLWQLTTNGTHYAARSVAHRVRRNAYLSPCLRRLAFGGDGGSVASLLL